MSNDLSDAPPGRQVAISQRLGAITAGLAYAILIVLGLIFNFVVLGLIEPNDAAATVRNIADSEALFRTGLVAFIIVLIADVVVAWGLYVFFRRTSREVSVFAAWFRLLYVAIAGAAVLDLLLAAKLLDGTGYAAAFEEGQRDAQVMLSLDGFIYGWRVSLVFFGVHLLLLGFVIVRSDYAPRILGIVVALAGLGYVVSSLAGILLPNFNRNLVVLFLAVVTVPGEFGLTAWLLSRAGRGQSRGRQPRPPVVPGVASQ
jgi:Domain of unknown function (DUF4386)